MSGRTGDGAARFAVPALSVALAVVLLGALAVAALGPGTASAATVLLRGAGVVVQLPDGTSAPLAEGQEVPRGAVVDAGRDGAVLRTLGRDTWLSGDASVEVVDGARQELRSGFVMVDARRGPELELATEAATVTTPEGAVSRVERAALLRVGSYTGDAVRVRAADRRAATDVDRAHQVQVPDGGLPGRVTPLVLTPGDAYERALASDLVLADETLGDLAGRLDAPGRAQDAVRAAALRDLPSQAATIAPAVAGQDAAADAAPASETALAFLLARADGDDDVVDRFARVRSLRADGGSWGVVAAIVDTQVGAVAALLDELLGGTDAALLAAEDVDVAALLGLPGSTTTDPSPADQPAPPSGTDDPPPPTGPAPPGDDPGDGPGTEPPPTSPLLEPLDTVVDTVLDLLPEAEDDLTETEVPALPGDPRPSPTPTSSGGLLDGLLR